MSNTSTLYQFGKNNTARYQRQIPRQQLTVSTWTKDWRNNQRFNFPRWFFVALFGVGENVTHFKWWIVTSDDHGWKGHGHWITWFIACPPKTQFLQGWWYHHSSNSWYPQILQGDPPTSIDINEVINGTYFFGQKNMISLWWNHLINPTSRSYFHPSYNPMLYPCCMVYENLP